MARTKKEEPAEAVIIEERTSRIHDRIGYRRSGHRMFWGLLFVAFGAALLAENFVQIDVWRYFWPLVLVVLGLSMIIRSVE